jgi:hypothetical protein
LLRALQHLPKIAVAGAVMQLPINSDRCPIFLRSSMDYGSGLRDLVATGGKAAQDGAYLARMNAPHARKTKSLRGLARRRFYRYGVAQLSHHAMRRHFAMRVAGAGNFHFGPQHQWVMKLVQCRAGPAQCHG